MKIFKIFIKEDFNFNLHVLKLKLNKIAMLLILKKRNQEIYSIKKLKKKLIIKKLKKKVQKI